MLLAIFAAATLNASAALPRGHNVRAPAAADAQGTATVTVRASVTLRGEAIAARDGVVPVATERDRSCDAGGRPARCRIRIYDLP